MKYLRQFIIGLTIVTLGLASTQAASIQGRYYTVDAFFGSSDDGMDIERFTHRPGFRIYELGDAQTVEWSVGVLEYEVTQEAIDKRMKAYLYLPRIWYDYIEEECGTSCQIDFHMTNAPALTLRDIANRTGMVLAGSVDAVVHLNRFLASGCIDENLEERPFAAAYPFSACHYTPVEIDFLSAPNAPAFEAGQTLTLVASFRDRFFAANTVRGTSDPFGLFAAGVRLSDQPLQPMASESDVTACNGKTPTLLGTYNNDNLQVPSDRDHVVLGLRGDDVIFGSERPDTICGGSGNDKLHGRESDDYLHGGRDSDIIFGGDDDDRVVDTHGHNVLIGSAGDDDITGTETSTCAGNSGRDRANEACGVKFRIEEVQ